jgi:hypothetical protein
MEKYMGAFDGLNLYQMKIDTRYEEVPDDTNCKNNWSVVNSNSPYNYPYGKKLRNPDFIGPHQKADLGLRFGY